MDKWATILIVSICFLMFAPLGCREHNKHQCRIEAIKAGVEADKINKACGVDK